MKPIDMKPSESESDLRLLRPRDVAEKLAMSRAQVYALVAEGVIPSRKLGACVRIPSWWVDEQTARPTGANGASSRRL